MSFVLQLRAVFTKRFVLVLTSVMALTALLQALRLRQYMHIYEVNGNIADFLLFTVGGWESPNLFMFLLTWLCLCTMFLYVSARSKVVFEDFGGFVTTRNQSRIHVWLSGSMTQAALSTVLFLVYVLVTLMIGLLIFAWDLNGSAYTAEFYFDWIPYMGMNFWKTGLYVAAIFISGLYVIFVLGQLFMLVSESAMKAVMSLVSVMLIGMIVSIYGGLPRIFALPLYMSTTSLNLTGHVMAGAIGMNIVLGILITVLGAVFIRKKDIRY